MYSIFQKPKKYLSVLRCSNLKFILINASFQQSLQRSIRLPPKHQIANTIINSIIALYWMPINLKIIATN